MGYVKKSVCGLIGSEDWKGWLGWDCAGGGAQRWDRVTSLDAIARVVRVTERVLIAGVGFAVEVAVELAVRLADESLCVTGGQSEVQFPVVFDSVAVVVLLGIQCDPDDGGDFAGVSEADVHPFYEMRLCVCAVLLVLSGALFLRFGSFLAVLFAFGTFFAFDTLALVDFAGELVVSEGVAIIVYQGMGIRAHGGPTTADEGADGPNEDEGEDEQFS